MHSASGLLALAVACVTFAACGGLTARKDALAHETTKPLAEAKDDRIHASIETVIVRNGPGAWTRDAVWDEYLIRIRALSDEPVEIREIVIFDALDHRIEPRSDRGGLVSGTGEIAQRYREHSRKIERIGWAEGGLAAGFLVGAAPAIGLAIAPQLLALPVTMPLVYLDREKVSNEIKRRATPLPMAVGPGGEASADLFFPMTSPHAIHEPHLSKKAVFNFLPLVALSGRLQVVYADRHGERRLDIDTRQALLELAPPTLVSHVDPEFPAEARLSGFNRGSVTAILTLDRQGHVHEVDVIESWPRHVFDEEAIRTLRRWIYTPGRENGRTTRATIQFALP